MVVAVVVEQQPCQDFQVVQVAGAAGQEILHHTQQVQEHLDKDMLVVQDKLVHPIMVVLVAEQAQLVKPVDLPPAGSG